MKEMNLISLNQWISDRKVETDRMLLSTDDPCRKTRTRPRDEDEINILDKLCFARWKKAETEGKIKYFSEREWYYECD